MSLIYLQVHMNVLEDIKHQHCVISTQFNADLKVKTEARGLRSSCPPAANKTTEFVMILFMFH